MSNKKILLIDELEQKNLIHISKEYCLNGYDLEKAYMENINKIVYKTKANVKKRCELISSYSEFINYVEDFKGNTQELFKDTTIKTLSLLRKIIEDEYYTKHDVIKDTKTLSFKEIKHKESYNITDKMKAIEMLIKVSNLVDFTKDDDKDSEGTMFSFITNSLKDK